MSDHFKILEEIQARITGEGEYEVEFAEIEIDVYSDSIFLVQPDETGSKGIEPHSKFSAMIHMSPSQIQKLFEELLDRGIVKIPDTFEKYND